MEVWRKGTERLWGNGPVPIDAFFVLPRFRRCSAYPGLFSGIARWSPSGKGVLTRGITAKLST